LDSRADNDGHCGGKTRWERTQFRIIGSSDIGSWGTIHMTFMLKTSSTSGTNCLKVIICSHPHSHSISGSKREIINLCTIVLHVGG
jgi:hypothetical protein